MAHTARTPEVLHGFDLELPLHPATDDAEDVALLLNRLLGLVDEFCTHRETTDADVIQALTLATALRAVMADASERIGTAAPARLLDVQVQDAPLHAA
jgi:hypothetical protein